MALGKALTARLAELAAGAPQAAEALRANGGSLTVVAAAPGGAQAALRLADHDRFSVALESLAVELAGPAPADPHAFLAGAAASVARALSYLEEPLAVWELDGREGRAELRSSPPLREGESVTFWEVEIAAGARPSAAISRRTWAPGQPGPEAVQYPATFALVGRIADTLAAALEA